MGDYHNQDVDYYGEGDDAGDDVHYRDYYDDEDGSSSTDMSAADIYTQCLEPTLMGTFHQVVWLLTSCLLLRLLNHHLKVVPLVDHLLSTVLGLGALFSIVGMNAVFTIIPALLGYLVILHCSKSQSNNRSSQSSSQIATIFLVCYLVVREHIRILPESWEQVRGIQMIMVMKILSICFDMGINRSSMKVPLFYEYVGYIFCPINLIFGPWIPFDIYCRTFCFRWNPEKPSAKVVGIWSWILPAVGAGVSASLSLGVSTCILHWIFLGTESRWLLTIRDAMAVRFSHYFISFLSELCCLLGGFGDEEVIAVTEPWRIECPRSLVDVVICWNKPMHRWLRVYIFRPCLRWGAFKAVLVTFAISSMLHGLNFGLTSVLLSLGGYTYVEHRLREKLASIYNACIRSRKCNNDSSSSSCSHQYKSDNLAVIGVNVAFGLLAFFNLAYLGVMISKNQVESESEFEDASSTVPTTSVYEEIKKWSDLGFLSHLVMILIYLATLAI